MIQWLISILIVLLIFWIGFCVYQCLYYYDHYDDIKFSKLHLYEKLVVITVWIIAITLMISLFIGLVISVKSLVFGGN